jgi:NADPH:quinone reductase-like Zn-dependent oxidoreductase
MKAAILDAHAEPPRYGEFPVPEPDDAHAVVEVTAAGVNHVDLLKASGTFYTGPPPLPSVVGSDGVGRLEDGRRVFFDATCTPYGSMAEWALVPRASLIDVPDEVDDAVAAAIGNCGLAAWLALTRRARLVPGETVLVLGASGAVGSLAVQCAKVLGAGRVIAAARHRTRLGALRNRGADATVELRPGSDLAGAIGDAAEGKVDVTIDLLWGEPALAAMRVAAPCARHVQVGQMAALTLELPAPVVRSAPLDVLGFAIFHEPIEHRRDAYRELAAHVADGSVSIDLERLALSHVATAWERQRDGAGAKLVMTP